MIVTVLTSSIGDVQYRPEHIQHNTICLTNQGEYCIISADKYVTAQID